MIRSFLVAALLIATALPASADVSDAKYVHCTESRGGGSVCEAAAAWYLARVKSSTSHDDKCHAMFAASGSMFAAGILNDDSTELVAGRIGFDNVIDHCDDPWQSKARVVRGNADKYLAAFGGK